MEKKFVPDCEHEQQNDGSARKGWPGEASHPSIMG